MDGIRYDRQTVGRANSPRTLAQKKARGSAWYDKPTEWLGAATGAVENAFRLPEDASNPMTWVKGFGATAKSFLYDPLKRTFTGEEAMQNYLNPRGGFGPSRMAERAVGVMSDALNVMSVLPVVGQAARGSVTLENALARKMAGQGFREAPMIKGFSSKAASKAADAALEQSAAESQLRRIGDSSFDENSFFQVQDIPVPPVPEGNIRVWHSTPTGGSLPPKLMSMREAARIGERRGSGATQLLSGGMYATEGRTVSASYPDRALMGSAPIDSPVAPRFVRDLQGRVEPVQGQARIPPGEEWSFASARSRAALDRAVNLTDTPTPQEIEELAKVLEVQLRYRGGPSTYSAGAPTPKSLEKMFVGKTWGDILDMDVQGMTTSVYDPMWDDTVARIAARGTDAGVGSVPFVYRSDQPVMYRGQLVDKDHPYYVFPRSGVVVPKSASKPFQQQYAKRMITESQPQYNQDVNYWLEGLLRSPEDRLADAAQELAYYKNNPASAPRKVIGDRAIDDLSVSEYAVLRQQNMARQLGQLMRDREEYLASLDQPWNNPFNNPVLDERPITNAVPGYYAPGQNYWDLPVTREGELQGITQMGGMRAFDIGNIDQSMADELAETALEFMSRDQTVKPENVEFILQQIDELPGLSEADQLESFRNIVGDITRTVNFGRSMNEGPTAEEMFYQLMTDKLGFNAMPHPGGTTVGGMGTHQAVVFNRPELLPPSTYVPGNADTFAQELNRYNTARVNQYYANRINQNVGQSFVGPRPVNPAIANMAGRMATNLVPRAVASSTPQRRR